MTVQSMTVQDMRSLVAASGVFGVLLAASSAWATTPKTSAKDLQLQSPAATTGAIVFTAKPTTQFTGSVITPINSSLQVLPFNNAATASVGQRIPVKLLADYQPSPYTSPDQPTKPPAKPVSQPTKPVESPNATDTPSSLGPVTSVSQLSDVRPTDWAFQALQSLVERYGCIVGYPDRTYRGNRALSRYEFAAGLNACIDLLF